MFCHLYQWRIEKEIDDYGRVKNAGTLRHLKKCSRCQSWLQSLIRIERRLKTASPSVSDSHIQQVQTAVHQYLSETKSDHKEEPGHKIYKLHRIRYAVSAAAVIVAVCGLFSLYYWPESDKGDYRKTMGAVKQISGQLRYQISTLVNQPERMIESEMRSIETCGRNAVGFVRNCLPQGLVAADLSSEKINAP